jgi:hypothetical protein
MFYKAHMTMLDLVTHATCSGSTTVRGCGLDGLWTVSICDLAGLPTTDCRCGVAPSAHLGTDNTRTHARRQ